MVVRGQGCRDIGVWGKGKGTGVRGMRLESQGLAVQRHRVTAMRSLVRHGGIVVRAQWASLVSYCSRKQAVDKGGLRATDAEDKTHNLPSESLRMSTLPPNQRSWSFLWGKKDPRGGFPGPGATGEHPLLTSPPGCHLRHSYKK